MRSSAGRAPLLIVFLPLTLALGCSPDADLFNYTSGQGSGSSASSGGGGGSDGAGGGSASASSGAGGSSGPEDCLDNVDNDGDKLVDCADPKCNAGFECVDEAPGGWEGYFRVRSNPYPNTDLAACPDGSQPETYFDTPSDASCSACSCGAWMGGACSPAPLMCWIGVNDCSGAPTLDMTPKTLDGACIDAPNIGPNGERSCRVTGAAAVVDEGACPPSGGTLTNPAPWANQDEVCSGGAKVGGGCGAKQACVPRGGGSYNGNVCIRKAGSNACPQQWGKAVEMATGAEDDRQCDACQCAAGGATCAGGAYLMHDGDGCSGATIDLSSMACQDTSSFLDNGSASVKPTVPQAMGGACAPTGGVPSGSVQPQGTITVCCK